MQNFWDFEAWGGLSLLATLLIGLLIANAMKKNIKFVRKTLIPTPVLGGLIILIITTVYEKITGQIFFNTNFYGGSGLGMLEILTYHCLALGFIASTLKRTEDKFTGKRKTEIFNTGVTTVSTYLIQGIFGMAITIGAAYLVGEIFPASGIILPFGFGQGPGQALNYGNMYEQQYGFVGGRNFGLTIAAIGFIAASIGGVVHLHILKKKKGIVISDEERDDPSEEISTKNEIPMNGTIDKLTVQIAFIFGVYALTYAVMYLLGKLMPGMISVVYGFNFLIGVLMATLCRAVMNALRRKGIVVKRYTNNFLLTHISNLFFDIMIVACIAAIRLEALAQYWWIIVALGIFGTLATYWYNLFIARKFFPAYSEEQFLMMYGMLTGTASTGVMLLRELDPHYKTPVAENLIYQNLPAIAFGFPMMLIAPTAPEHPELTLLILVGFFVLMNLILFRNSIFKFKKKSK